MRKYSLNGTWQLKEEPLSRNINQYGLVLSADGDWLEVPVPGDVHQALLAAGKIPEPLAGLNSFETEWIEDRSWWYRKSFVTGEDWLQSDIVELEINGLDVMAEIFINGVYLGQHPSAFRPFIADISELLNKPGQENLLVIRLTSGLEHFSEEDISEVAPYVSAEQVATRGDKRRVYVRKPQYSFGWDWNPRVPTCGITGDVSIRPLSSGEIRDVRVDTVLADDSAILNFALKLESLDWIGTQAGRVKIEVEDEAGHCFGKEKEVFLRSGNNHINLQIKIDNPQLWWPNGMGEQHLYRIKVTGEIGGEEVSYPQFKYGARTVELDQSRLNEQERLFALVINGKRVYCRGANWIPADSIYGRAGKERYKKLIKEAEEANFTMLRIWGGGLYERDCFYEFCDEAGIMVWHDFMFACGAYPDHEQWFVDEVQKEAEFQTERLHNHACIVLWSGSNENNWGFKDWWHEQTKGGAKLYNNVLPDIAAENCPDVPYWNGSPYGGSNPNSARIGDRHHWHDCMMNPEMEKRITPEEYDKVDPKFISEYGYIGPSRRESIEQYLGDAPFARGTEVWQHHNNTFEKDTVLAGIKKHYIDPADLTDDEYLLYAGLVQGLMYEYSLDSFRARLNCSGGLFWMYNDCWGEVGWTIVDYYLNRKISYNYVRRANAPVRLIMRKREGEIKVIAANDTSEQLNTQLETGYVRFDGSSRQTKTLSISVPPFSRKAAASLTDSNHDLSKGCIFAQLPECDHTVPAIFRAAEFCKLEVPHPQFTSSQIEKIDGGAVFRVESDKYAHAVHFNLPVDCLLSDEYFDLLPGESRTITVTGGEIDREMIKPESVKAGSRN